MPIGPQSLEPGNQAQLENVVFSPSIENLKRKIIIVGNYDETIALTENEPFRVFSAEQVGKDTGWGYMLHRLAQKVFRGTRSQVETWVIPQPENVAATAATGSIDFTASAGVKAGTIPLYLGADRVPVLIADGDDGAAIASKVDDAVDAIKELPVTSDDAAGVLSLTAKSKGTWGNDITIEFALQEGESLPDGVSAVVTDMAGGAGLSDIQDALDALGLDDAQNEKYFTDFVHGYGLDTTTLDAISSYNGIADEESGNHKPEVSRFFRSLVGDTTSDVAGFSALLVISGNRKELDRTNGVFPAPGSPNHPQEIAAQVVGVAARINNIDPAKGYTDEVLEGIFPGALADRWTNNYDRRDEAVRNGVSTSFAKNNLLTISKLITFYHPDAVPQANNGYRDFLSISKNQNITNAYRNNFYAKFWKQITLVQNKQLVSDSVARFSVRDIDDVISALIQFTFLIAEKGWIFTPDFTISEIQKGGKVELRDPPNGFNITYSYILSGEGGIFNSRLEFDTSIAILS